MKTQRDFEDTLLRAGLRSLLGSESAALEAVETAKKQVYLETRCK
jgi:hypothetical protein